MNSSRKYTRAFAALTLFLLVAVIAGCGGGSDLSRVKGLSSTAVVDTFFNLAKAGKMEEAGLYVSDSSRNNARAAAKFISGEAGLKQLKKSSLLSLQQVAAQDNYAVVAATLQEQGTLKVSVTPVGLEKVDGEWYIVDLEQIYQNAKYQVLNQLLKNVKL